VWIGELRASDLQQLDYCRDVFLFGLSELIPPSLEYVCDLNLSFHIRNIADKECIVNLPKAA